MQPNFLEVLNALMGPGFVGAAIVMFFSYLAGRRKHDAEVANLEARTRKTNMEIDELGKNTNLIDLRQREVGRVKAGNKKTIVLREEERKLRGGME